MKKLLFFTLLTASSAVYASDEKKPADGSKSISYSALNQFAVEFPEAANVQWSTTSQYQKANFQVYGEKITAYYNTFGEYLGATKFVSQEMIPAKAKADLAKKYADYNFSYAIQVISRPAGDNLMNDTGSFWVDLVSDQKEVYVRVSSTGSIELAKQVK